MSLASNERKSKMKSLVCALAAVVAVAAFAEGPKTRKPWMESINPVVRVALNPKAAEKLGITEEQAAKLKTLEDDKGEMKELQEKVRKGMERQAELMKAEKIDEAAVMASLDEVWAARKEIAKKQTARLISVKSILTPEQVAKAREAIKSIGKGGCRKGRGEGKGKKPAADAEVQ